MEREVSEERHDSPKEMQESWVEVGREEGHVAQGSSSEEVTKLLADAVEEEEASGTKRRLQESYKATPHFMASEEYSGMATKITRQEHERRGGGGFSLQDIYSRLLRGLQDLLHYLTNPAVIASHLAAFGIGCVLVLLPFPCCDELLGCWTTTMKQMGGGASSILVLPPGHVYPLGARLLYVGRRYMTS